MRSPGVYEEKLVPPLLTPRAEARVNAPVDEKLEVAVPPKYAVLNTERRDVEALVRETREGRERVTAPVEAEAVIWLAVPVIEVTPLLVTTPAEYERPVEKVVVATHVGTPEARERICPPVPAVVVERAPEPLPRRRVFDVKAFHPVPPFETETVEVEVKADVPFPTRMPVRVVAPVPP